MIIKTRPRRDYTTIPNQALQDRGLSFEARGMLGYLLSLPEDWTVRVKDLQQGCGRDRVYRILNELKARGYIRLVTEREDGRFAKSYYVVYDTPQTETPVPENPDTVNADAYKGNNIYKVNRKDANASLSGKPDTQNSPSLEDHPGTNKTETVQDEDPPPPPHASPPPPSPRSHLSQQQVMMGLLAELFDVNLHELTDSERSLYGRVAAELRKAGATADEVGEVYALCKRRFPYFTPKALPSHLSEVRARMKPSPTAPNPGPQLPSLEESRQWRRNVVGDANG